jgi:hypothetical protein
MAELREEIINFFDIARQEGMLKSKDGKHSRFSESDAEDVIDRVLKRIEKAKLTDEEIKALIKNYRGRYGRLPEYTPEITPRDKAMGDALLDKIKKEIGG